MQLTVQRFFRLVFPSRGSSASASSASGSESSSEWSDSDRSSPANQSSRSPSGSARFLSGYKEMSRVRLRDGGRAGAVDCPRELCRNLHSVFLRLLPSASRLLVLLLVALALLYARVRVMGSTLPHFTTFDNPAAHAPAPARQLTFAYLLALNARLLLWPAPLLCDWSMGTVPLVASPRDPLNAATAALAAALCALVYRSLTRSGPTHRALGMVCNCTLILLHIFTVE